MENRTRLLLPDIGRALAAVGVVAFHSNLAGEGRDWHLSDLFFVISGFVLAGAFSRTGSAKTWSAFILKRLFRFLPLIWVALAVKTGLVVLGTMIGHECLPDECSVPTIIGAALLLQVIIPATIIVLVPLWSLSVELVSNMIFAAVLPRYKDIGTHFLIFSGLGLLVFGIWVDADYVFGVMGPLRGFEALGRGLLGIGVGILISKHRKSKFSPWLFGLGIGMTILMFVLPFSALAVVIAPIVFGFLFWNAEPLDKLITSERLTSLSTWASSMSFGVYVWHGVLIGTITTVLKGVFVDGELQNWAVFITTLAASLAMATITYKFIETPAMRVFHRSK